MGGSVLVGPYGQVLASAGEDPQLVMHDLDLAAVGKARETLAVLSNRSSFAQLDRAESRG